MMEIDPQQQSQSKWRQALLKASRPGHLPRYHAFKQILEQFGFRLISIHRLHNIFVHEQVPELLNVQNINGETKPFQVRQAIGLIYQYHLKAKDE